MLDYCGEIELYPMDGEWDNYYEYTPIEELGLDEHLRAELRDRYANNPVFVKDSNWYDIWASFDRIIERDICYSILRNNTWMNIPKKIVREIKDNEMFVYGPIFNKICEKKACDMLNSGEAEL
jgi:hypothetical protein